MAESPQATLGESKKALIVTQLAKAINPKPRLRLRPFLCGLAITLATLPAARAAQITVAATADLRFALPELARNFERETGHTVKLSFGARVERPDQRIGKQDCDCQSATRSYGRAADAVLRAADLYDRVRAKLVYNERVGTPRSRGDQGPRI